jgi:serine/threonine protein kinase
MASVRLECPECGALLKADKEVPPGKRIKCPQCGNRFVPVPAHETIRPAAAGAPPEAAKPLAGDTPSSRPDVPGYSILGELGRGGMGVVYKARQLSLDRLVALKMILAGPRAGPQEVARFRSEAAAVAQLQHPNIVQIYEVGEYDGLPFFCLELVNGPTLARRVAGTPQPGRPAAALVETLARAIAVAHERGIVHRDLKPANVLLATATDGRDGLPSDGQPYGVPKITDFGLAKRLDSDAGQTRTGDFMGTPCYVAPEQARGQTQEVGPAVDVYALGVILYELLAGRPPFLGSSAYDTLTQVTTADAVPPSRLQPGVSRDLEAICLKCLSKQPHDRYTSALSLAEDLRRYLNGEPTRARPPGPGERLKRWCLRYPVPASLLVASTLCLVLGFFYLSRLTDQLVRAAALDNAARQSDVLRDVNDSYTDIVKRAQTAGVEVTHLYAGNPKAIPIPATFTIELAQEISDHSESGVQIRVYSDFPFRSRRNGGPRDDFERAALRRLRDNPAEPAYSFEDFKGRPSLRYSTARVMQETCVDCHNTHPESPKTDWKVGDVRGVVEVIYPLDRDVARTREGLWGAFVSVAAVGAAVLGLAGLALLGIQFRTRLWPRVSRRSGLPPSAAGWRGGVP